MAYIITNGVVYLDGNQRITKQQYKFKTEESARNFYEAFRNSKKRKIDIKDFKILDSSVICQKDYKVNDGLIGHADINLNDALGLLEKAQEISIEIEKKSMYLEKTLEQIENEIDDILHYIELSSDLNVVDGYKVYKQLKSLRKKRRKCKDELLLLGDVFYFGLNDHIADDANKLNNSLEFRTYSSKSKNIKIKEFFEKYNNEIKRDMHNIKD